MIRLLRVGGMQRTFSKVSVKNGYGGRSTGTSAVPQIADDLVHRASRRRWAKSGNEFAVAPLIYSPGEISALALAVIGCRRSSRRDDRCSGESSSRGSGVQQPGP